MVLSEHTLNPTSRFPETPQLNRDFQCHLGVEIIGRLSTLEIDQMRFLHPTLLLATLMHLTFNVAVTFSVMPLETQMVILAGLYLVLALAVTLAAGPNRLLRRSEKVIEEA